MKRGRGRDEKLEFHEQPLLKKNRKSKQVFDNVKIPPKQSKSKSKSKAKTAKSITKKTKTTPKENNKDKGKKKNKSENKNKNKHKHKHDSQSNQKKSNADKLDTNQKDENKSEESKSDESNSKNKNSHQSVPNFNEIEAKMKEHAKQRANAKIHPKQLSPASVERKKVLKTDAKWINNQKQFERKQAKKEKIRQNKLKTLKQEIIRENRWARAILHTATYVGLSFYIIVAFIICGPTYVNAENYGHSYGADCNYHICDRSIDGHGVLGEEVKETAS